MTPHGVSQLSNSSMYMYMFSTCLGSNYAKSFLLFALCKNMIPAMLRHFCVKSLPRNAHICSMPWADLQLLSISRDQLLEAWNSTVFNGGYRSIASFKKVGPGVRFSKDPKTSRGRKLFGALFGLFSRVPESVSQSPRKQPGFQANVSGFFSGWRMAGIGR